MEEKADLSALRYTTAEFERMAAAAEMMANSSGPGRSEGSDVVTRPGGDKNTEIMTLAVTLLNAGVDTKAVGQILIGSSPTVPILSPQGGAGISVDDILKVTDKLLEAKGDSEKDSTILDLKERLARLETGPAKEVAPPLDPLAQAVVNAKGLSELVKAFKELGLIRDQPPTAAGEQTLEQLKEANRHAESMEELHGEREHKQEIAKVVTAIPERIGRGVARELRAGTGGTGGAGDGGGGLESFTCGACQHLVYVPPDAGETLRCGNCGETYRKGTQPAEGDK